MPRPYQRVSRQALLAFWQEFYREHGKWPTQKQCALALGVGVTSVQSHLDQLQSLGLIKMRRYRAEGRCT